MLGIVPQAYNPSTLESDADIICPGSELQQELLARDGDDGGTDTKGVATSRNRVKTERNMKPH